MDVPEPLKLRSQVRLMERAWQMGEPYRYRPMSNARLDAYSLDQLGLATWEARYNLFTLTAAGIEWCRKHFGQQ